MEKLLFFPCNGNSIEALDCLAQQDEFVGFIDDSREKQDLGYGDHPVFDRSALTRFPDAKVLAVPGSAQSYSERSQVIASLELPESRFARVIHPAARVSRNASIGINTLMLAGSIVTSNAALGNHICILANSVVHHDCSIGDYTLIGSNVCVAGHVEIRENVYVGSGSSIRDHITVGEFSLIGLGAVVVSDIAANSVVIGNPARQL